MTVDVPPGADVVTAFGDGRQNAATTPTPGFVTLLSFPVQGPPVVGDQDLYTVGHLAAPHTWSGGPVTVGTVAPPPSGYWGLVSVAILPAT